MVNILKVTARPKLHIRLRKLDKTSNCWVFTFADAVHKFEMKMLVPFVCDWEAAETAWDKVHEIFLEGARKNQWDKS